MAARLELTRRRRGASGDLGRRRVRPGLGAAQADLSVEPWRSLTKTERAAVEAEAASLPRPGLAAPVSVRWLRNTGA